MKLDNKLFKNKYKRNLRKGKQSDFLTGVITLSPIINTWLEETTVSKVELDKCFNSSIPLIQKKIQDIVNDDTIKLSHYVIHYDEKTPHLHFAFYNHTKNADAVYHLLRNSGKLSQFQDIVGNVFKSIGLERGDKKSTTKHMSVRQMHEEELKQLKLDIKAEIKTLQNTKKDLKKTITDKKQLKVQLDDIDKSIKTARLSLKNKNTTIDKLEEEKTRLEQSINDLRPINPDIDIYSSNSIIKHISNKKTIKVKDGLIRTKEIEITEFINEKSLRDILDTYNSNLLELKNTPLINKKIEDELETTKKKLKLAQNQANANLSINKKLNTQVKTLEKKQMS